MAQVEDTSQEDVFRERRTQLSRQKDNLTAMQQRYEAGMRDMEARIEQLSQEIAYRAEYLQKERSEVQALVDEVEGNESYLREQKARHGEKTLQLERERRENKKLQGLVNQLQSRIELTGEQIAK